MNTNIFNRIFKQKKESSEKERLIQEIIQRREPEANLFAAKMFLYLIVVAIVVWCLFLLHAPGSYSTLLNMSLLGGAALLFMSAYICYQFDGKGQFIRYLIFGALILFIFFLNLLSGYKLRLLGAIPILLSIRYYNKTLLRFITVMIICTMFVSTLCNAYLYDYTHVIDLNMVFSTRVFTQIPSGHLFDTTLQAAANPRQIFLNGCQVSLIPNIMATLIMYFASAFILDWNIKTAVSLQEALEKQVAQQIELSDMKARVMLSQLGPHFLYNALNTITALCRFDPPQAQNTTAKFADYLRTNMDSLTAEEPIQASEELEHVRIYLEIEHLRFLDKLNYEFDTPDTNFFIPSLALQYLVRNSVEHGLCRTPEGGTLRIATRLTETHHIITVADDGAGFDVDQFDWEDTSHLGLRTVRYLVSSMVNGELSVESEIGKGTIATIRIPVFHESDEA